jgi:uncharacterized protein YegL
MGAFNSSMRAWTGRWVGQTRPSGSMGGAPIRELNAGLQAFKEEISHDSFAMKRVEIAVLTFGPVKVETEFQTVDVWQPHHLTASGGTPMGEAITHGLPMLVTNAVMTRALHL